MESERKPVKEEIKIATARLLKEKSYLNITVTDIVNEAKIARVSFYRNYKSIAEVFDDIVDDIFSEINSEIIPVLETNNEAKWRELLYFMFCRFPKHHSVSLNGTSENMNELFSRMTVRLQNAENPKKPQTLGEKYLGFGKVGLIVNIIKLWMAEGKKESPEEMVDFIMTFITGF